MKDRYIKFLLDLSRLWVFPILMYFIILCILTYPLIFRFHTHFFADTGDGLQNVWNIWWVNKAVTQLHQSPWYTTYLHYPKGTSLLGHTLNPFNGFLGIFLLKFLSLIETHNVIVIFSFVIGGFTAFWLSYFLTKSYWSSLIAGCIFTFSQYHFMHAEGHLQLVSLEWIPLFILMWYLLLIAPSIFKAIISAVVLFGVLLCDHYYFLCCILTAILMILWRALSKKDFLFFLKKKYLSNFIIFIFVCLLTSGILVVSLLQLNRQDPLLGYHNPLEFSLDLLAPFIPGGHWRFSSLTQFYWSRLPGNINESSVYMGLSVIFLTVYVWIHRHKCRLNVSSLYLWYGILFFFGIMALGPALHIGGKRIFAGIMPYDILQTLIPPLKLSGCPVRLMVMVMLSASVISAIGLCMLFRRLNPTRSLFIGAILGAVLLFDSLPKPIPSSKIPIPGYIDLLKNLPENGGIIDTINPGPIKLYYQTIHERPMGDGYISRYPTSVYKEYVKKIQAIQTCEYTRLLEEYNICYLLTSSEIKDVSSDALKSLYGDNKIILFQITNKNVGIE